MAAQTVLLGGHVRVGLEDNLYLEKGKLAPSNAALVEKAAKDHRGARRPVATPADARQMLGLGAPVRQSVSATATRGRAASLGA